MRILLVLVAAVWVASCASYDGRGLVPGASTVAQVESVMGKPAERMSRPDGGAVLYYPRNPGGRHTFAVTVGPDGVMRGIEQRLTLGNINRLVSGKTTSKEVREMFGPPDPHSVSYFPLMERDVWEYKWLDYDDKRVLWVHFSRDGILREVINTHDFGADEPTGGDGLP